ncbi:hypothetical protein HOLleu_43122 [Holothuria leucospilota]|uniref:Uncharacterized protein n=1 Tax=Holothuria leucospilota TaxID=206669 RepID=A0A9Q0Y9S7_HOLLE|nr:hypothetical protein HOLleu_43122 [Holothuria leucospilota]
MPGIIHCTFEENMFGVLWYNSTDFDIEEPIVTLFGTEKGGPGFLSGEFDVLFNGSLIINNVTLYHEHSFYVSKFSSQDDDPVSISVEIIVTGKFRNLEGIITNQPFRKKKHTHYSHPLSCLEP